jgi:hypothetical protein
MSTQKKTAILPNVPKKSGSGYYLYPVGQPTAVIESAIR